MKLQSYPPAWCGLTAPVARGTMDAHERAYPRVILGQVGYTQQNSEAFPWSNRRPQIR